LSQVKILNLILFPNKVIFTDFRDLSFEGTFFSLPQNDI
jgi:hypothetical protein